jgi:cytochrome c553
MMKLQPIVLLSVLSALSAGAIAADGSAQEGEAKATPCIACHGPAGNSANPEWPNLAGQHAKYVADQLHQFKSGARQNPLMTPMAAPLSEDDMADLAAYYSEQTASGQLEADAAKVPLGQRVYRSGDANRGVAACIACHGPNGRGNPTAGYPSIRGQHATYVAAQLRNYRSGTRATDPNQMMRNVASNLTDEQIDAVAAYVQGLR